MAVGNNPSEMRLQLTKFFYRLSVEDNVVGGSAGGFEGEEGDFEGLGAAAEGLAAAEDKEGLLDSVLGEKHQQQQ